MLESLFKKTCRLKDWHFFLKKASTKVFFCEVYKTFKNTFFIGHLQWLLLHIQWLLLYFLEKVVKQLFRNLAMTYKCFFLLNTSFDIWKPIVSFVSFLNNSVRVYPWSREQYFPKHRFLDIYRCAFNNQDLSLKLKRIWSMIEKLFLIMGRIWVKQDVD